VATHSLKSDSGIVVPAGTELILERWMPEGFAALEPGINVEGITLENIQRRTEQAGFLRIPYFVDASSECITYHQSPPVRRGCVARLRREVRRKWRMHNE